MIQNVNRPVLLFFRGVVRFFIKPFFHIFKGYKIIGKSKLPKKRKPMIMICNHAAFIDSVYIICALRPRFTICGAKPKYFAAAMKRLLFSLANIIKVEGHAEYLADCGRLLSNNELLLIYPEMGRNKERMGEFKTWAADVALAHSADVLPLYIYGTTKGQSKKIRLAVGDVFKPEGTAEDVTRLFREKIEALRSSLKL